MIIQNIYLEDWDWHVTVFYDVNPYNADEVLKELEYIGCSSNELAKAEYALSNGYYNTGLTYTNTLNRYSVVVIGVTTNADEFQNTFDHEKGHLAMHIGEYLEIDIFGEEFQYLTGTIGQKMFKIAKRFMCDYCRSKVYEDIR